MNGDRAKPRRRVTAAPAPHPDSTAKLLDLETVPCRLISSMSAAQKRAYVLADNKLALNAGWDEEMLAIELAGLLEVEVEFDVCVTGFTIPEIDSLIAGLDPEQPGDPADDRLPDVEDDANVVTQPGDLWLLGPHKLICGNALEAATYARLLGDEPAAGLRHRPAATRPRLPEAARRAPLCIRRQVVGRASRSRMSAQDNHPPTSRLERLATARSRIIGFRVNGRWDERSAPH